MKAVVTSYCIGWWNVRLRLPKDAVPSEGHIDYVFEAIKMMVAQHSLDILFLGEITEASVEALRLKLKQLGFRIQHSNTNPKFNLAVAFNPSRINVGSRGLDSVVHLVDDERRKVAQKLDVTLSDGTAVRFYPLHWPSRLYNPKDSALRSEMASYLRDTIRRFQDRSRGSSVVILGDFNDEPSDLPLMKLLGTRDVQMAKRRKYLFYNPFWRFLLSPTRYSRGVATQRPPGTFFYKKGKTHQWHVLDQMLFSSSFFGKSDWHLAEGSTMIFTFPGVCEIGPGGSNIVDHLPILAAIERIGQ